MKSLKTWTCPKCGLEFPRQEGQDKEKRCKCGTVMDVTINFEKDGQIEKKILDRLED